MVKLFIKKLFSRFLYLGFLVMALLAGCGLHKQRTIEPAITLQEMNFVRPMITVFVHGTRLFPKFGLQERLFSATGLIKISDLDKSYSTMHMIAQELSRHDSQRFGYDRFYAFGWEGELNFDARREAARELYVCLNRLIDEHAKQSGVRPRIRLITHSHGGNVALNLAAVKNNQNKLIIDELILLACPVQEETKHLIDDPIFCKKYALCSMVDLFQVVDPQWLQRKGVGTLFSERWFPCYPQVIQAKIKMSGRAILHVEFLLQRFIKRLPEILDIMDDWREMIKGSPDQVQLQPFPLIDLRAKSIRLKNCPHVYA